jgi:hypothetical protein
MHLLGINKGKASSVKTARKNRNKRKVEAPTNRVGGGGSY